MHIAVVSQNADLVSDMRPRAEAEALARAGYEVTLVGGTLYSERLRDVVDPNVSVSSYPLPAAGSGASGQVAEQLASFLRLARSLAALSRHRRIDVVHAGNPPDNAFLLLRSLRVTQGRTPAFVFDQHDAAPVLLEEKFGSSGAMQVFRRLASSLERSSFRRASLVVFANERYAARAGELGFMVRHSAVVPNGWVLPASARDNVLRESADHLLAYVGTVNEQDGVGTLVDAVAELRDPGRVRVVVAGAGSALEAAKAQAKRRGVNGSFRWLGWVNDRERIATVVRTADVCVAPEGESAFNALASFVKIGEYMSAGKPVAAYPLAQNVALAGDTIHYASDMSPRALAEAIETLLADPGRSRTLGAAARTRFEREISWEHVGAPRLVAAYRFAFGAAEGAA